MEWIPKFTATFHGSLPAQCLVKTMAVIKEHSSVRSGSDGSLTSTEEYEPGTYIGSLKGCL
jgi:hypothetical protein